MDLNSILLRATQGHFAVPHFNFSDLVQLKAIVETARRLQAPVMVGTSEGERDFIGLSEVTAVVDAYRGSFPYIYLNADHTKSVERAKEAIDSGYLSVHIDLSKNSFDENLKGTSEVVSYARSKNQLISVEGEVGQLPTDASEVLIEKVKVDPALFTKPEEAVRFVKETGVNRLASVVGSIHGIAANEPHLDFSLIEKIRKALPETVALVLHGGSGVDDESLQHAVASGIANVHISTEIRVANVNALRKSLENKDEVALYKIYKPVVEAIAEVVEKKIRLCGAINKV